MLRLVSKSTSINLRVSPEFRGEIEALAAYHGLSMSSYAHSLLVKAVRIEKEVVGLPGRALDALGPEITNGRQAFVQDYGEIGAMEKLSAALY